MPITDLTTIDIVILVLDAIVVAGLIGYYYKQGNSFAKCRRIELNEEDLRIWRLLLYSIVFATWFIAFGVFVEDLIIRHFIHPFILVGLNKMFEISIPAYICKRQGFGGTCNCDFYVYNDFYPMLILGSVGNLIYAFTSMTFTSAILFQGVLILLTLGVFLFMPLKDLKPLKYPPEMLISEIDALQAFLMQNPNQKKLLTVLDAKCDFCEIQVNELLQIPEATRTNQLRIFDLTFMEQMDPYIPMTLNMNTDEKIPVPTTFIFDSGMAIEQKDGVLSKAEIEFILIS